MFAKNSKAYSVYLLFRFVCSLAVSMSTVLSIVYHMEVVQLDACMLRWMNLRRQRRMCGKGLRSDDGGEGTKAQTKGNNV